MPFRLPLTWGEGLDRYRGSGAVSPASFEDLRNVLLLDGRVQNRGGLASRLTLAGDETILLIHPIRAQGIGAVCSYDEGTRNVKLYTVPYDMSSATLVGTLWTNPATAGYPRLIAADSYNKLVIAHDEWDYSLRQETKVVDPIAATINSISIDLGGGAQAVRFRGVARHLAYMVGWGYGNLTEPDRPELVRISKPGDPTAFEKEHYFIAGQRGDAVVAGASAGSLFLAFKEAETYEIFGTDRTTFGIRPADPLYGAAGGRLVLTVGGVCYFWSLEGPRRSAGGLSQDLALPLHLAGPRPSSLAPTSLADGFTTYNPETRVLEFTFDRWGYQLHIAEPDRPRWTFAEYPIRLYAGGALFRSTGSSLLGPASYPTITSAVLTGANDREMLLGWTNSGGAVTAADRAEVWAKPASTGVWQQIADNIALAGPDDQWTGNLPLYADNHEVAVRFKRNGIYAPAYNSNNPSNWPAASRWASVLTELTASPTFASLTWERLDATTERILIVPGGAVQQPNVFITLEKSTNGGGAWSPADGPFASDAAFIFYTPAGGEGETDVMLRAKYHNGLRTGPWSGGTTKWIGPDAPPSAVNLGNVTDGFYSVSWTPAAQATTGWETELWAHKDADPFALKTTVGYSASPATISEPCPANDIFARARHKTTFFGTADYSDWSGTDTIPADCDGIP